MLIFLNIINLINKEKTIFTTKLNSINLKLDSYKKQLYFYQSNRNLLNNYDDEDDELTILLNEFNHTNNKKLKILNVQIKNLESLIVNLQLKLNFYIQVISNYNTVIEYVLNQFNYNLIIHNIHDVLRVLRISYTNNHKIFNCKEIQNFIINNQNIINSLLLLRSIELNNRSDLFEYICNNNNLQLINKINDEINDDDY